MSRISKSFALFFTIIIAISSLSLMMIKPAGAQSIPTPSVPQFTVKFVNASYSVITKNSYTGINEIHLINNNSIEVSIKNQPFDSSNYQMYFNVRAKPHLADNWTEVYPLESFTSSYNANGTFSYAEYISSDSPSSSSSSYTVITFPVVPPDLYQASGYDIQRYYSGQEGQDGLYWAFLSAVPPSAQIDFQVETQVGHASQMWVIQHPFYPLLGGMLAPAVAYDSASGWSVSQTIIIGQTSVSSSASPSPSSTPTVPEFSSWTILLLFAAMSGSGWLVYFKKHKR
jgi:hypothetical protein